MKKIKHLWNLAMAFLTVREIAKWIVFIAYEEFDIYSLIGRILSTSVAILIIVLAIISKKKMNDE